MPTRTIDLDDDLDSWRYRCPCGHTDWYLRIEYLWCKTCRRKLGRELEACRHDVLVDTATGERIPRHQIDEKAERRVYLLPASTNAIEQD